MTLIFKKVEIVYADWKVRSAQTFEGYVIEAGSFYIIVNPNKEWHFKKEEDRIILAKDIRGIKIVQEEEVKETSEEGKEGTPT